MSARGPVIRASDRVLIVGFTGSGKSTWLLAHAALLKSQLLIIDVKGDIRWKGEHENVYDARGVARALKRSRVVRLVLDDDKDRALLEAVFEIAFRTPGLTVLLDEAIGTTEPNYAPRWLRKILVQGRSRGVRVWAGAQRPVGFTTYLRNQADHILVSAQRWSTADLRDLAVEMGYDNPRQLRDQLQRLNRQYGELGRFAFVHFERATGKLWARPPLPEWMRKL